MFVANFALKNAVQKVLCEVREILDYTEHHPVRLSRKRAALETVDYIAEKMSDAIGVYNGRSVLDAALAVTPVVGEVLEFGVYRGGTINYLAKRLPERVIHGFDSFEGLPHAWAGHNLSKSAFDLKGNMPSVAGSVRLHKGWFDATLPAWKASVLAPVAFLHIDCDLYSSTTTVLQGLSDRMKPGTVIVFDEYFGYPGWKNHEFKAFSEFIKTTGLTYKYLAYAAQQVAVQITE